MVPFLTRLKKGGSHLAYGLSMAMIPTIFRCPTTGLKVQGLFADESPADASEWFTVRLARAVFRWAPSHRAIARISELFVLLTAVGVIRSLRPRAVRVATANAGPQPHR